MTHLRCLVALLALTAVADPAIIVRLGRGHSPARSGARRVRCATENARPQPALLLEADRHRVAAPIDPVEDEKSEPAVALLWPAALTAGEPIHVKTGANPVARHKFRQYGRAPPA